MNVLRRLDDFPDHAASAPAKKRRLPASDVVAVLDAVARGMPTESACHLLGLLGIDEPDARKMVDPAKARFDDVSKADPVQWHNHFSVPDGAIRVEAAAPLVIPAPVVNVPAAQVVVKEAARRGAVVRVKRNNQGRLESLYIEPVE